MNNRLSKRGGIAAMVATMMGTGINFMPYAFSRVGYINGLLLISGTGIATFFSLYSIAFASKNFKGTSPSYTALAQQISNKLRILVDITIFFNSYLANISFYKYLSSLLVKTFPLLRNMTVSEEKSRKIVVLMLVPPFYNLILRKNFSRLSITTYFSFGSVTYLALLMFSYYFAFGSRFAEGPIVPFNNNYREVLSFFVSAMVCQANMVKVYTELSDRSFKGLMIVCACTALAGTLIYGSVGYFGYQVFGSGINHEVIRYLANDKHPINVYLTGNWDPYRLSSRLASYGCMLVLFGGFPIQLNPVTGMLMTAFPSNRQTETLRKSLITILFIICTGIALTDIECIIFIKRFSGATFSNAMAFLYPSLYYLYARKQANLVSVIDSCMIIGCFVIMGFMLQKFYQENF